MSQSAIATYALQALEVIGNCSPKVAFYHNLLINDVVGYKTEFLLVQFLRPPVWVNTRFFEYFFGTGWSNAVNIA